MQYTVYERTTLDSFLESILKIESVEMKDEGEYTCTANNEAASAWATATIRLNVLVDEGKAQCDINFCFIILWH